MLDWLVEVFKSPWTYGIMLAIALFFWAIFGKYFRRLNLKKGQVMLIGVIGLALTLGVAGMLGVGTTGGIVSSGLTISQIQTTTAYTLLNVSDSGVDDTRMSDFYPDENILNGNAPIDDGVWLVTRSGSLSPASCQVKVIKPPRYDISDTTYHIVDEDANTGVMYAYIYTGTTTDAADGTHPKETNMIAFDEGVSTAYVSVNITLDETGFDPLTQYDYKDIHVDICGYPYVFRVHKSDA